MQIRSTIKSPQLQNRKTATKRPEIAFSTGNSSPPQNSLTSSQKAPSAKTIPSSAPASRRNGPRRRAAKKELTPRNLGAEERLAAPAAELRRPPRQQYPRRSQLSLSPGGPGFFAS